MENLTEAVRRKHLFIVNPRSFRYTGGVDGIVKAINEHFQNSECEFNIHISRYPRDAIGVIQKFAVSLAEDNACLRVYAVGGDGILFDCLNGIIGLPNTELAAMPYGITNDFVKAFGKNNEGLFKDLALMADGDTVAVDAIHCGSNYAMNLCLIGTEAVGAMSGVRVGRAIERNVKTLLKVLMPLVFMVCSLSGPLDKKVRLQKYEIMIDEQQYNGSFGGVYIANGPYYGGGYSPVRAAAPDDGALDVLFFKSMSIMKTLQLIPEYLKGKYYNYPDTFIYSRGKKITVNSEIPLVVNLDGETFFDTNLDIDVVPGAVRFVTPAGVRYERVVEEHESK